MAPEDLARTLEDFLAGARDAVVLEDGKVIFDFGRARYSVSAQRGKCLLHLWSEERNTVRRVLDCQQKSGVLRLSVQRFGQSKPARLEICRERDRRAPSERAFARLRYLRVLERALERGFPGWTVGSLSSAMDLERSFGPIYARGLMRRGGSAFAILGVNAEEAQASVDAALTIGLLWLDLCRGRAARVLVEGLKLFVPAGSSAIVRERMAHLNHAAAKFELYELDEREESLAAVDCRDRGNIATRLVQCPNEENVRRRFAASIARVLGLVPKAEVAPLSAAEVAFRLHGLEFARARLAQHRGPFSNQEEIVFGAGPCEFPLTEENAAQCEDFLRRLVVARRPGGSRADPLWRMQPERWLESLVVRQLASLDSRLDPAAVYSQVPAFSACDRAMIDVLGVTRDGRLAVLELKADEDLHLPLQGLDYWARVTWHHQRGEFQRFGYFPGRELSPQPPLLFLVTPSLHVHPTTDTLLRYISPDIDCTLLGIHENWREELRVIFRKHPDAGLPASAAS
ncbi:MAG TPA: hypothetical protein VE825_12470 [Terriglobales bacterium]|jgi:hypothetical protein|nr:hypothetical protein [Terriglobales bacterium]